MKDWKSISNVIAGWEPPPPGDSGKKIRAWRKATQKKFEAFLPIAAKAKNLELYYYQDRLIAVYLCFRQPRAMVTGHSSVAFRYDPKFRALAQRWLADKIRAGKFGRVTDAMMRPEDEPLLKDFYRAGFSLHSTILVGEVSVALRELMRKKNPPADLQHLGLEVRAFKAREVPALLRMQKRVFTRIPERGYFTHTKPRLEEDRKEYLEMIRSRRKGTLYGIWKGKRLMGFFGLFLYRGPLHDDRAGTGMMFDFPIQGKGIAKTAYRIMLEEASRRKVRIFHGGTSQPAVMGLGKIMKRKVSGYLLMR